MLLPRRDTYRIQSNSLFYLLNVCYYLGLYAVAIATAFLCRVILGITDGNKQYESILFG